MSGDAEVSPHIATSDIFNAAAAGLTEVGMNLTQSQQLEFYALYKIAVKGPCDTPEPSFFYPTERRKWNAYNDLTQTGISSAQAQFNYVQKFRSLYEDYDLSSGRSQVGFEALTCMSQPAVVDDSNVKLSDNVSTDLWCQLAQENDVPAMEVMLGECDTECLK